MHSVITGVQAGWDPSYEMDRAGLILRATLMDKVLKVDQSAAGIEPIFTNWKAVTHCVKGFMATAV